MSPTALVIDDNAINTELMTLLLEDDGFDVSTAEDAETALRLLDARPPDVIIVDVQLPGMSGLEFLSRLRAGRHRHICAIVVTSFAMESDRESARAAGGDGYLSKPIDTRTFAAEVRRILGTRNGH